MGRGINWWVVALIAVAVVVSGVGLLIVASGVVFAIFGFGDDDLGPHGLDAKGAAEAMELRRIGIPDGVTFEEMTVAPMFAGADFYRGRCLVSGSFDSAKQALAQANPDFPRLRAATCDDEIVEQDFVGRPEFHCDAGTQLAISTRVLSGEDVLTDNYRGTPPDCETVLLVRNGDRAELFVLSQGH
ncbi:hypothetical protein [Mycolicibacterium neworleansense]|uniref:Uncharacterized protein n=1 Tax=Mycolicibacterium neworleansense TaxID=146018 RepID=A0A0H5RR10_9MYCO|nr:hypothetical protein [Mycolicibacterium neworleansense]MCV7365678.1 hypothetical protein [Mycolicibacterium neworleansense]CRZ16378.1 hypothetical protein BN2156_03245 [Mycolicibacterium neworleansense]